MGMIGERIVRTEDPALLTGNGTFVDNLDIPGAVHVVYARAQMAHARITGIDIADALEAPGVLGVFTAADLDLGPFPIDIPFLPAHYPRTALASDVMRYVGEPVVAVVAETRAQATDAAQMVIIDADVLPRAVTMEQGFADEVLLFPESGTNVCVRMPGGPIDFGACEVVVRADINNQRVAPSPMEGRVAASRWEPDGRLTHWQSCQGSHPVQAKLCEWYGLEPAQVRVITPDVGGGFGAKAFTYPEDQLLPWLARAVGRPVRYTETRSEGMNGLGHGRAQLQHIEIGGDRDGRVTAYQLTMRQDAGAYPRMGSFLPFMTRTMLTGTYDIANAAADCQSVLTNTVPTIAYRGAGRPEAAAAIERAMDLFAREIGMDPVEVRRRNLIAADRFPFKTATGTTYDSGDYEGGLDKLLAAVDYAALRREQTERRERGDTIQLGIGVSVYVEITGGQGGTELGEVHVTPAIDGSDQVDVRVVTGTTPYGQGHRTTWAMLVADRLGVPFERITVVHGDTDLVSSSNITGGSRSVQIGGTNVVRAAASVADQARDIAARLLEADVADVVLEDGRFHVAGTPSISRTWLEVATAAAAGTPLYGIGDFTQSSGTFPSGAHLAVVELDIETGQARLRQLVAVDDAGTIVNPLLAEGQVHGGLAQGIAQALFEEVVYDDDGNPLTSNFADYGIVSAAELPSFQTVHAETPTPLNELGAKGIGESGTIGATPAVQSAVIDAVAHLGVRHIDMPCTPNRVWNAIRAARA
ncbi:MAG: Carbon-monoxide dehydrogenase, molybdopterin binding, large subunit [Ilumatobacteraceae bacterium]|nr:Carbon-monoxide dehydrogenase, molybdopterin binding, large subunit [Ilumatobacteraceae bacterium]